MKPLIHCFLPLCNLPTFKLPGLGLGLVTGLVFASYESVCITSAITVTLPKFASD